MKSVKNQSKQKYTPCELKVVEFNVERGFAASPQTVGEFRKNETEARYAMWMMNAQSGVYRNNSAQYDHKDGNSWF